MHIPHCWKSHVAAHLYIHTGLENNILSVILQVFSYLSVLTYVLSAQKNRLIEIFHLHTHNICFG